MHTESKTILIAEDSPIQAAMLELLLISAGYTVIKAVNGKQALAKAMQHACDLIISDIIMPEMNGYELCSAIKEDAQLHEIPVLLITSFTDKENLFSALEAGAEYFITKPYKEEFLLQKIKSILFNSLKDNSKTPAHDKRLIEFDKLLGTIDGKKKVLNFFNSTFDYLEDQNKQLTKSEAILQIQSEELKRSNKELFKAIVENNDDGILMLDPDGSLLYFNDEALNIFGAKIHHIMGDDLGIGSKSSGITEINFVNINNVKGIAELRTTESVWQGKPVNLVMIRDITERKQAEKKQLFMTELLIILNQRSDWHKIFRETLARIKEFSGVEAVGIRLKEEEDYPYFETIGFSKTFIKKEMYLSRPIGKGDVNYNPNGNPFLECMCGNIISKHSDSSFGFFTGSGSFWTNSTTKLLAVSGAEEHPPETCKYCNKVGYESVALISLVAGDETIGLLQLNDKHPDLFDMDTIRFLEETGNYIVTVFEKMEAEKLIKKSEEKYRTLFDSASNAIIIADIETGIILDANKKAERILGRERAEIIGLNRTLIHPSDKSELNYLQFIDQIEKGVINEDAIIVRKDGTWINVQISITVADIHGKKVIQEIFDDITERIINEHKLRKLNKDLEKLSIVASKTNNAVFIGNSKGIIEWVNESYIKMFGYESEEIIGTTGLFLRGQYNSDLLLVDYIEQVIQNKACVQYESLNYTKSGEEMWILAQLTPTFNENGEIDNIIGIESDISVLKRATEELTKAKETLEAADKIKDQFLANVSHEFRTPLNGIYGMSHLLLNTDLSEEQSRYVDTIKISANNLSVIINDILDVSKIVAGHVSIEKDPFNLRHLISSIINTIELRAKEKNLALLYHCDQDIPEILIGDKVRLGQVLLNFLINAIKFTEKGEIKLSIELKEDKDGHVLLEFAIADTGMGIPENKINEIFKSFTQLPNPLSNKYEGTGLGLTISRELTNLMGGEISVESTVDVGTTFKFQIQFEKPVKENIQIENRGLITTKEQLGKLNILLVEDNEVNQLIMQGLLESSDISLRIIDSGTVALDLIRENSFDVVLMDIMLTDIDGIEASRNIRTKLKSPKCDVPIIAMSAFASGLQVERFYAAGMNDYLFKPFEAVDLYSKIFKNTRTELPF